MFRSVGIPGLTCPRKCPYLSATIQSASGLKCISVIADEVAVEFQDLSRLNDLVVRRDDRKRCPGVTAHQNNLIMHGLRSSINAILHGQSLQVPTESCGTYPLLIGSTLSQFFPQLMPRRFSYIRDGRLPRREIDVVAHSYHLQ